MTQHARDTVVLPQWHGRVAGTSQGGQGPGWQAQGHLYVYMCVYVHERSSLCV